MTECKQVYRCEICGNIVEVVHAGKGQLSCCGQPMKHMSESIKDGTSEKHVPVIEKTAEGYTVTVGEVEHPMLENHYIEWIELVSGSNVMRKYLKPGEKPVAEFKTCATEVYARAYCNLHGLWSTK